MTRKWICLFVDMTYFIKEKNIACVAHISGRHYVTHFTSNKAYLRKITPCVYTE
jgi:hypothetical protein